MKCPYCDCSIDIGDNELMAQREHMVEFHAEIIKERLETAGFYQDKNGDWIDRYGE